MPPPPVGSRGLLVATLMIADHHADVRALAPAPAAAEQHPAAFVQRPAHLLHRHLRVFPPAAAACAPPRTPTRSGPAADDAPAPHTADPRSGSAPPLSSPPGSSARSSHAGTPRR